MRSYRVEVIVINKTQIDDGELKGYCEEWGIDHVCNTRLHDGSTSLIGDVDLSMGVTPDDSHERLKELLPRGTKLVTNWLSLDREWDETHGEE